MFKLRVFSRCGVYHDVVPLGLCECGLCDGHRSGELVFELTKVPQLVRLRLGIEDLSFDASYLVVLLLVVMSGFVYTSITSLVWRSYRQVVSVESHQVGRRR